MYWIPPLIEIFGFPKTYRKKKQWVRPYYKSRLNNGEFARCYKELRENATHFFEYTRMAPFTFDYILNHVRGNLHRVSNFRECISIIVARVPQRCPFLHCSD
uniref:Uncharacterized protein n=1 Tax=Cacopsylla melanoneura TaxID=428564 RepID=A0A8D8ZIP1_9HEMI